MCIGDGNKNYDRLFLDVLDEKDKKIFIRNQHRRKIVVRRILPHPTCAIETLDCSMNQSVTIRLCGYPEPANNFIPRIDNIKSTIIRKRDTVGRF